MGGTGRVMSEKSRLSAAHPSSTAESGNSSSAHEAARFIASVSLSLGALMLSLFGIIERMVTFEKLAIENEFALLALLPGIATLAFLACARAISWMISYMRFVQWHAVFPEDRWEETRRLVEESSQFRFRLTLMAGAYLLFTLVITALGSDQRRSGLRFVRSGTSNAAPSIRTVRRRCDGYARALRDAYARRAVKDRCHRRFRDGAYRRPCARRGTLKAAHSGCVGARPVSLSSINNWSTCEEAVMFQQLSDGLAPACNDNGSFFRRGCAPTNPMAEQLGPICLSYLAQGVFIISGQEPTSARYRRGTRAA